MENKEVAHALKMNLFLQEAFSNNFDFLEIIPKFKINHSTEDITYFTFHLSKKSNNRFYHRLFKVTDETIEMEINDVFVETNFHSFLILIIEDLLD